MSRRRLWIASIPLGLAGLLWVELPTSAAGPHPAGTAVVRLYSNGKVVAEWKAVGPGRVDGNTFVFPVQKGVQEADVRISGTFSYEEEP